MLAAPRDGLVELIRSTARFGEKYALSKYDALCAAAKEPVNPIIHSYYMDKCKNKKKSVAAGAVMHKVCNIIFAMLRDNKPFELVSPQEHGRRYAMEHPAKAGIAA